MAHPQSSPRGFKAYKRVDVGGRKFEGNTTGYVCTAETAIPTTDQGVCFTFVSNSTGLALAINTTGTTWKYLSVTSVQAT